MTSSSRSRRNTRPFRTAPKFTKRLRRTSTTSWRKVINQTIVEYYREYFTHFKGYSESERRELRERLLLQDKKNGEYDRYEKALEEKYGDSYRIEELEQQDTEADGTEEGQDDKAKRYAKAEKLEAAAEELDYEAYLLEAALRGQPIGCQSRHRAVRPVARIALPWTESWSWGGAGSRLPSRMEPGVVETSDTLLSLFTISIFYTLWVWDIDLDLLKYCI